MSAILYGHSMYVDVPAHLKLTLCALADEAADDGSRCYPGMERLAVKTSSEVRTVRRNVAKLEELGYVVREIGQGGGRRMRSDRRPNLYRLDAKRIVAEAKEAQDELKREDTGDRPSNEREDTGDRAGGHGRPPVAAYGRTPASSDPVLDPLMTLARAGARTTPVASDHEPETQTEPEPEPPTRTWLTLIVAAYARAELKRHLAVLDPRRRPVPDPFEQEAS